MRILIINGSPREKSYTKVLANFAFESAKKKHKDTDFLDLSKGEVENFVGYEGEYNDKTKEIVESLKSYDVFIICSPIYDGLLSAAIKNLFEHADYKALIGKVAGFIIMAAGKISYLQVQSQLTAMMTYFTITSNPKAVHVGQEAFTKEMSLKDEEVKKRIVDMIDKTVGMKS